MPTQPYHQAHQVTNRLKTVAGHVRGVQRMVEADAYCIDIIKQTQAVQRALDKVNNLVLEEHLNSDVITVLRDEQQHERERIITELLQIFRGGPQSEHPELPAPASRQERNPQRLAWLEQIETRVRDIQRMLEAGTYPITVLLETKAVQRMLDAFQSRVLADHLNGCVITAIRSQQAAERERIVSELLQVFATTSTL